MITRQRLFKWIGKHISRTIYRLRPMLGARTDRHCPACGSDIAGYFPYGPTPEWGCPKCGSSPRERLMCYLLDTGKLQATTGAVLHMAPTEASLVNRFRPKASDYVPADIDPDNYSVPGIQRMDLMALDAEAKFDRIYASHVMEHVPDDAKVLANMARALKPGGEAWLIVPLWDRPSEEGTPGMTTREREIRFGQWDHVRQYGMDFADRLKAAGLQVEVFAARDMPPEDVRKMGLDDVVFRARR